MASEKHETVAEALQPLRDIIRVLKNYAMTGGKVMYHDKPLHTILDGIADRLEAAWKRELVEVATTAATQAVNLTNEKFARTPVGNAAACHEAQERIYKIASTAHNDFDVFAGIERVRKIAIHALSAPARNCDRFKTREEARQYFDDVVCLRSNGCGSIDCKGCSYDSIDNPHRADCREQWLLAPAAERKGEGDGSK